MFTLDKQNHFFLIGFQKCATTWLHRCFEEHPQIFVPTKHMINYFDINFYRGIEWYQKYYIEAKEELLRGDTTVSYARSAKAIERIYKYNPNAKILISLRNPIDRAFSHYWHENKKKKSYFSFEECLNNYDLFNDWIEPGFYSRTLINVLKSFPERNVFLIYFDSILLNPQATIQNIYKFLGVNNEITPMRVNEKSNVARDKSDSLNRFLRVSSACMTNLKMFPYEDKNNWLSCKANQFIVKNTKSRYELGMSEAMRSELKNIYSEEILRLSYLCKRDLSHWLN